MLIWSGTPPVDRRNPSGSGHVARLAVLFVAAGTLGGVLARPGRPPALRGPAAVRALERATGVTFGDAPPATPDLAIIEIGPPMARRVAGNTLVLVFAVPRADDATRLSHVAIRWVHEAPLDIAVW